MAIKRALVVDDSKAARLSLKKLLGEHNLEVSLAASGEEALSLLQKQLVDVIFMDHTMPGMDGLEAVSAIKSNPRTATIPVMMYTTREGEVYVGQARALGAVGVLPKNVEPQELFQMLLKLGLVAERRGRAQPNTQTESDKTAEIEPIDQQVQGVALQAVVHRILEDQHVTLRSDILRSQRSFAKDVAREVLREHHALEQSHTAEEETSSSFAGVYQFVIAIMLVAVVISGFLAWQFKRQLDVAMSKLERQRQTQYVLPQQEVTDNEKEVLGSQDQASFAAIQHALNMGNEVGMYELAFDRMLAEKVIGVVPHLEQLGFEGDILLISHLGQYCLDINDQGLYVLAEESTPAVNCTHLGNVADVNNFVDERMSGDFSEVINNNTPPTINVRLEARYIANSLPRMDLTDQLQEHTAGEYNQAARLNNRVEVRLLSR